MQFLIASLQSDQGHILHKRIIDMRHQIFAHSDARPQKLTVIDTPDDRLTLSIDVSPLERWEAEGLLKNVCQMQEVLKPYLKQSLAAADPDETSNIRERKENTKLIEQLDQKLKADS